MTTRQDAAWLDAHWMPFTGNRQFKANPRMIVGRRGRVLHRRRRQEDLRRALGPVVLRPRPRPPRDRRGGRQDGRDARLLARVPVRPSALVRAREQDQGAHARRSRLRVLHRLGLRVRRHVAQDGARVLAREGPGHQDAPDRPREGLSRRQLRRHLGRRHRRQPQGRSARRVEADHLPHTQLALTTGARVHARHAQDAAPSSPTSCST